MWLLIEKHSGENGTESRIPVCHHCDNRGDTEAEKTSCLFCNRTNSAVKLFQDVHHMNVTPWNSKAYHKRVKTLFGRDCWWSSNPTSWSVWGCRLHQPQLWGLQASRDESPEPQQAASSHAEPSFQGRNTSPVKAMQERDCMAPCWGWPKLIKMTALVSYCLSPETLIFLYLI